MERNTTTTASELQIGDRFYKCNDKHKTVLQMVEHESKVTKYQTYKHWCKPDGAKFPDAIKGDTMVVFLRNVNDKG
jgi:hypothetical protein